MGVLAQRGFKATKHNDEDEMGRILALPAVPPLLPEEEQALNAALVQANPYAEGWRMFPPQANGIATYCVAGGLFGPIGVGWGKQVLSDMCAQAAWEKGLRKILLMVPPDALNQVWQHDIPFARKHVNLSVPFFNIGRPGLGKAGRHGISHSGRPGCYVNSYSCLSIRDTDEILRAIAPQLIILDEAHLLRDHKAARTKRIAAYFREFPETECIALSGTMTRTSIKDYRHILMWCLKANMPLPLTMDLVNQWSAVLDARMEPTDAQRKQLERLRHWAGLQDDGHPYPATTDGYRKSYQRRLTTARGVVATGDTEIGVGLTLANVEAPVGTEGAAAFEWLEDLMDQVSNHYLTPNGDIIEHAIHTFKWLWELSAGFYNELTWPVVSALMERLHIGSDEAGALLEDSKAYYRLTQVYAALLRSWLKDFSFSGCDTPFLVGGYMAREGPPRNGGEMYNAWCDMRQAWDDTLIERDSRAVRVCDYKIAHAVQWAKQLEAGGLIWYDNIEIGLWLTECLRAAGIDVLHACAGEASNAAIINPANADRVVVASLNAHGRSKNLQYNYSEQMFVQWSRGASDAEQVLGRTHRNGQKADHLIVVTTNTTEFDQANFGACLNDATYIHQTTGVRQKLVIAGYDPPPIIFPPELLQERGFRNELLSAEQRRILQEKFGICS